MKIVRKRKERLREKFHRSVNNTEDTIYSTARLYSFCFYNFFSLQNRKEICEDKRLNEGCTKNGKQNGGKGKSEKVGISPITEHPLSLAPHARLVRVS